MNAIKFQYPQFNYRAHAQLSHTPKLAKAWIQAAEEDDVPKCSGSNEAMV